MISDALRYFIVFLRKEIQKRTERDDYTEVPTSDAARTTLIIAIRKIFPDTIKDRDLRLGIIMALTGIPISTQNDLPAAYTYVVIGALNDNLAHDSGRKLSTELQEFVEGEYVCFPWQILTPIRPNRNLPNMWTKNDKDYADGFTRGVDLSEPGPKQSLEMADKSPM